MKVGTGVCVECLRSGRACGLFFHYGRAESGSGACRTRCRWRQLPGRHHRGAAEPAGLYLMLGSGRAISYPVGVGRHGMQWSGTVYIDGKYVDPAWTAPASIRRDYSNRRIAVPAPSRRAISASLQNSARPLMTVTLRIFASVATPLPSFSKMDSFHARSLLKSSVGSVKVMPRCADSRALTI